MQEHSQENMQELDLDTLDQVVGGVHRTINTGIPGKSAAIRSDASTEASWIAGLPSGTVVDTVTDQLVRDKVSGRNFVEIDFTDKNGNIRRGWVAASIVGLPR